MEHEDEKLTDDINPEQMDLVAQAQAEIRLGEACESLGALYEQAPVGISDEQCWRIMTGLTKHCARSAVDTLLGKHMDDGLTDDEIADVMGMSIEEVWSWKKAQEQFDAELVKAGLEPRHTWE